MKKILTIGLGGCGSRLAHQFQDIFNSYSVSFNTCYSDIENKNVFILKDSEGKTDGSSRNPEYTLNSVCDFNKEYMTKMIEKYYNDIDKIIIFSSLGGGSGSALHNYIISEIIKGKKKTFSVLISPFISEGNPCNTNFIVMLKMFIEKCSNYSTPILLNNDDIFIEGSKSTYDITNRSIVEYVYKILDFELFAGKIKKNGLSSLDKNEFDRILSPCGGFFHYTSIHIDDLSLESLLSKEYDLNTAKRMIILFQSDGTLDINKLKIIHEKFPDPVKIISESKGNNIIKIIANGLEYPTDFGISIKSTIKNVNDHTKKIEKTKNNNKKLNNKISNKLLRI